MLSSQGFAPLDKRNFDMLGNGFYGFNKRAFDSFVNILRF